MQQEVHTVVGVRGNEVLGAEARYTSAEDWSVCPCNYEVSILYHSTTADFGSFLTLVPEGAVIERFEFDSHSIHVRFKLDDSTLDDVLPFYDSTMGELAGWGVSGNGLPGNYFYNLDEDGRADMKLALVDLEAGTGALLGGNSLDLTTDQYEAIWTDMYCLQESQGY